MTNDSPLQQIALLGMEAILVASLLLSMFRLRNVLGFAPIYTSLGVISQMAALFSASVYIKLGPHLTMGPGSTVLFPACLFVVLFVYIREDALAARQSIYALVAANFVIASLDLLVALHLKSTMVFNPLSLPIELFTRQPRMMAVSTVILVADTILTILIYEALGRTLARHMFVRTYLALSIVLLFDSVCFVTGCFYDQPDFKHILLSDIVSKGVAAVFYAGLLTVYLSFLDIPQELAAESRGKLRDIFHVLTYREKYEALKEEATHDALTGLYNRRFFDGIFTSHVASAKRSGKPLTVILIDADHFKAINDMRGHAEGDRMLVAIATAIKQSVRLTDIVTRYGGEEFVLLLPDTPIDQGEHLAERIRLAVPVAASHVSAQISSPLTVTIGVATMPDDAIDPTKLLRIADERMYAGKRRGRDRVVTAGPGFEEVVSIPSERSVVRAIDLRATHARPAKIVILSDISASNGDDAPRRAAGMPKFARTAH